MDNEDIRKIFDEGFPAFDSQALSLFQFQYRHNPVYRQFADLTCDPSAVNTTAQIPFLPVSFFKSHPVCTTVFEAAQVFESSGTTGAATSRHFVRDQSLYDEACIRGFERVYGPLHDFCFLALLPSYLERGQSSLVYMVNRFMEKSGHPSNGFYLHNTADLARTLHEVEAAGQKTLLIGVTYALLDFADAFPITLNHTMVMETGGMKGRKKELLRSEVHEQLRAAFGVETIHSEYGMTELLSQAYATKDGRFVAPPWMKVMVGDEDDPRALRESVDRPVTGVLHVADLANAWSCAFIATEDLGRLYPDGSFEVLGRIDHSDIRGCSLLAV
ncbi:MAG: acyl transferase [Flaviaesturariibacter sp.]|nr:acyl transferase [Flaviaesturariibacter sp.]